MPGTFNFAGTSLGGIYEKQLRKGIYVREVQSSALDEYPANFHWVSETLREAENQNPIGETEFEKKERVSEFFASSYLAPAT